MREDVRYQSLAILVIFVTFPDVVVTEKSSTSEESKPSGMRIN